jgi:hypothetical protein
LGSEQKIRCFYSDAKHLESARPDQDHKGDIGFIAELLVLARHHSYLLRVLAIGRISSHSCGLNLQTAWQSISGNLCRFLRS